MKRVLDVGQCAFDHASIRRYLENEFDASVVQAHSTDEALSQLRKGSFDLVLINRILDADGSEGLEIIEQIKADPQLAAVPVMMVTNYPEHQEHAVDAGAEPGFGKAQLETDQTRERLSTYLGRESA